jgi:peptidylprolyl isomerase
MNRRQTEAQEMLDLENKHCPIYQKEGGKGRRPSRKVAMTVVAAAVCVIVAGVALTQKKHSPPAVAAVGSAASATAGDQAASSVIADASPISSAQAADKTAATGAAASVASLGTVTISRQEVEQWLAALPPEGRAALQDKPEVREQWMREHLAEKALAAEARSKNWDRRPEVISAEREADQQILLRSYLDAVSQVPQTYPSAEEISAAYEQAKGKLQVPARYHLRQIYLAAPSGDAAAVASVRKQAAALVVKARAGGADFAELARQFSQDAQSVAKGGDIGELPLQQLTPEVRGSVAALGKGDVSDPIESAEGFHIIKLEDVQPARTATLEEVTPQLRAALRQQRQRQQAQDYLAHLTTASPLNIDDAALTNMVTQP